MKMLWTMALSVLVAAPLAAQDIAGDWQATIASPAEERLIVRLKNELDGSLHARIVLPDRGARDWGTGAPASGVSLEGSRLRFGVDSLKATFEGELSADKASIRGTWASQGTAVPLELRRATSSTAWPDPTPHQSQLITVDTDVTLEVLDWGGSGQPLVLLAGLGNTAHVFDSIAPKLTAGHRVYGITRRGFGASSTPSSGYAADRLADDVIDVANTLKIGRAVFVGHSVAGQELTALGSRYPDRVAALVYLEAGYAYAFHDPTKACTVSLTPRGTAATVAAAIQAAVVQTATAYADTPRPTDIKVPVLAVYADVPNNEACAKAFGTVVPTSRVVRLPGATHYIFGSNEADVLRELRDFFGSLGK